MKPGGPCHCGLRDYKCIVCWKPFAEAKVIWNKIDSEDETTWPEREERVWWTVRYSKTVFLVEWNPYHHASSDAYWTTADIPASPRGEK